MANKIRPFGVYKVNMDDFPVSKFDVQDCQDMLPKGERIRNKKKKRRVHNKMARGAAKKALREELAAIP